MAHSHSHFDAHDHGHGDDPADPRVVRALAAVAIPVVLVTVIGLIALWPSGKGPDLSRVIGASPDLVKGTVTVVEPSPCLDIDTEPGVECYDVRVELAGGPDEGQTVPIESISGAGAPEFEEGDKVVLGYIADAPPGSQYYFSDFQRRTPLLVLGVLFVLSVVVLGRWRGVRALVALGATLLMLVQFLLPALLEGDSPLLVAVIGSMAVMLVVLYLTHGVTVRATTAVLGTAASLVVIVVLAALFVEAAQLTGLASEEAGFLRAGEANIDLRGLLLAGVIIGSLGVLDDMTVTQVSAVWELHRANPSWRAGELYRAAERIGRDHIGSTVNTLVLAYAGASLPLLLLFTSAKQSLGTVLTGEVVAIEVVRTLVGSIGLVASVPITTALAAAVVTRGVAREVPAE